MATFVRKFFPAIIAALALTLGACAGGGDPGGKRTVGQTADDAALTARVKTAIATDVGAGTAGAINVQTYKGEVQLTGFVNSEDEANRALSAARKVSAVRWNVATNIVMAWIVTMPASALIAAVFYWLSGLGS